MCFPEQHHPVEALAPDRQHESLRVLCQNIVGENEPDLGRLGTVPMAGTLG